MEILVSTESATILSIQVGQPQVVVAPAGQSSDKTWTTGFLKHSVAGPIHLGRLNFDGDGQADSKHHGGRDKAVCVYPATHYPLWRSELRLDFESGGFGENLTVVGLAETNVCIGDIWEIGNAKVQVSQPRQPCWKLSRRWGINDLAVQVQRTGRTGWYLRVLQEGEVEAGSPITLAERPHPEWTIDAANELMHRDKRNVAAAEILGCLPELSASWRTTLARRCQKQLDSTSERRLFGEVQ